MKEERMMILTMLEEGKISSEEASKLLEALEESEEICFENETNFTEDEKTAKIDKSIEKTKEKVENIIKEQSKKVKNIGNDIGNKISGVFNSNFDKSSSKNFFGIYEIVNTTLEKDISHIEEPIIDLKSINGNIFLNPWDKDSILINVSCQFKKGTMSENDIYYDFVEEGNKISFSPIYTSNIGMKLDVYVPNKKYKEIILNTSNGKINAEGLSLDKIVCNTTNASILIKDINAPEVKLVTKNGKINMESINANSIEANSTNSNIMLRKVNSSNISVSTKNGRISIDEISSDTIEGVTSNSNIDIVNSIGKSIKLSTSNGKIICQDVYSSQLEKIELETSNASIEIKLPDLNKPICFDLETSLGNIDLQIPDLVYRVNKQNKLSTRRIIAHSIEFNEESKHIQVIASTSNGSIRIN